MITIEDVLNHHEETAQDLASYFPYEISNAELSERLRAYHHEIEDEEYIVRYFDYYVREYLMQLSLIGP